MAGHAIYSLDRAKFSALSTFGTRPFRYHPPPGRARTSPRSGPRCTVSLPRRCRACCWSCARCGRIAAAGDEDARSEYTDELMPAVERVADEGRMLFIQADT